MLVFSKSFEIRFQFVKWARCRKYLSFNWQPCKGIQIKNKNIRENSCIITSTKNVHFIIFDNSSMSICSKTELTWIQLNHWNLPRGEGGIPPVGTSLHERVAIKIRFVISTKSYWNWILGARLVPLELLLVWTKIHL